MTDYITAFAPATVANLGPGFDILGMAVSGMGDRVTVSRQSDGITISAIHGDDGRLPTDPQQNTAAIAAAFVLQQIEAGDGITIEINKGLPLASGLGSSAASAVAAAVATNALFGSPLSLPELLPACLEAEAAVSGRHADNVAPALLGGIVLVTGTQSQDLHRLPTPENLYLTLVTPGIEVPTAQARAVLPETVLLSHAVHQTRSVAQLVHALYQQDIDLLIQAMVQDVLITPARKQLIPHFDEAWNTVIAHGAAGMIISGAGPTLCVLASDANSAQSGGEALIDLYGHHQIDAQLHRCSPSPVGATIEND
jgi:homoserine kinase